MHDTAPAWANALTETMIRRFDLIDAKLVAIKDELEQANAMLDRIMRRG